MDFSFPALAGGILIGLSATLLLWLFGKIAGISNIVWQSFSESKNNYRIANSLFLVGLIVGCICYHWIAGSPAPSAKNDFTMAIVSGLLVGIGVKIGNGCTSGHGVCGISRLSYRSLVATLIFMLTAILTVFIMAS